MYIYIIINMFIMRWTQPYDIVTFTLWETKSKHRSCIDATKHELARSNFVSPRTSVMYLVSIRRVYMAAPMRCRELCLSVVFTHSRRFAYLNCIWHCITVLYHHARSNWSQLNYREVTAPRNMGRDGFFFERVQVWDLNIVIFRLTRLIYNRLV
jgi:hypothetical protein